MRLGEGIGCCRLRDMNVFWVGVASEIPLFSDVQEDRIF